MNCKEARIAIIRSICGDISEVEEKELRAHLHECPHCTDRFQRYEQVHDSLNKLPTEELPDDVVTACDNLLERTDFDAEAPDGPPANPEPVTGFWTRSTIFVACLIGLLIVALGSVYVSTKYHEPPQQTATIVSRSGTVKVGFPGQAEWTDAPDRPGISADSIFQTGSDGYLRVNTPTENLRCWVNCNTTISWPTSRSVRLARGSTLLKYNPQDGAAPLKLQSSPTVKARATSLNGTFQARATPARLIISCLSGSVTLHGQDSKTTLREGEKGVVMEGRLLDATRRVAPRRIALWRYRISENSEASVPPTKSLFSPRPTSTDALPSGLRIEQLRIGLQPRGALVTARITAQITNESKDTRQGEISLENLLWAFPVIGPVSPEKPIEPGQSVTISQTIVSSMIPVHETLMFGVMPSAVAADDLDHITVTLQADSDIYNSLEATTIDFPLDASARELRGRAKLTAGHSARPLVFRARVRHQNSPRIVWFQQKGSTEPIGIGAWQPPFEPDKDIKRIGHYLMAFDAAAPDRPDYFGIDAYDLADRLTARLSHRARLFVTAYDGEMKMLPAGPAGLQSIARERMMGSLWDLSASEGSSGTVPLLRWCAQFPARQPSVAFVLCRNAPQSARTTIPPPDEQAHPRPYVVNLGDNTMPASYRKLSASLEGATMHVPRTLSAEEAAVFLLKNLPWPGYTEMSLVVEGNATGTLITPPGSSSNSPIVFQISPQKDSRGLSGSLSIHRREEEVTTRFRSAIPANVTGPVLPSGTENRPAE